MSWRHQALAPSDQPPRGKNDPTNVLALCPTCNELMGERTLEELCAVRHNGAEILARATALLALPLDRELGRLVAAVAKATRLAKKAK